MLKSRQGYLENGLRALEEALGDHEGDAFEAAIARLGLTPQPRASGNGRKTRGRSKSSKEGD